jgi:hypothetical protein
VGEERAVRRGRNHIRDSDHLLNSAHTMGGCRSTGSAPTLARDMHH